MHSNVLHGSRQTVRCIFLGVSAVMLLGVSNGCYAPLRSPGIDACCLPDSYRTPYKAVAPRLNLANLTVPPPPDYILGPDDILEVTVPDLFRGADPRPFRAQVMANGEIALPLLKPLQVGGMNLSQAQRAITDAYSDGVLVNPFVDAYLAEKATFPVLVIGEVQRTGLHELEKFQNDVGHALAEAGGFTEDAEDYIEVHRRVTHIEESHDDIRFDLEHFEETPSDPKKVLRIPMRGLPGGVLRHEDVALNPGDVVVVPSRRHEVFFVVGQLDDNRLIGFSMSDRERELGSGLILPRDRDIDVVTAVVMAGYIDPIDSPTTVTVHRVMPDGRPMLITVDLIKARYDRRETILVQAGDIIYLNPDNAWWMRRTFDRIVPELLLDPYRSAMIRWLVNFD